MTTPRDTLKRRFGPGFWEDVQGGFHISVPEWLEAVGLPATPENRALATKRAQEILREKYPQMKVVVREEPDGPLA